MVLSNSSDGRDNNTTPMPNGATTVLPVAPSALIIDDNEYNRDIVRIALQSQGFTVTDFEDPVAAVALLSEQTFNLLVLDLQMPVLDGQQVLGIVKANKLHQAMQIIVLTAHSQMDTFEIQKKADYVMYKPINVAAFAQFANRIQTARNKSSPKSGLA
jgi:CheY-like chemotaxis protein